MTDPSPTRSAGDPTFSPTDAFATRPAAAGSAAPPTAPPGFELYEVLGRGGMGVVYRGRQIALDRVCAVKVISAGGHASEQVLARFAQEAAAVAAVRHPNVVEVYHAGAHAGLPYYAMEYVPGGCLQSRLRDGGPLPPREAAQLVEQVARGVAACHASGVLHRDLKPANVLLANAECGTRNAESKPAESDSGLHSAFRIPNSAFRPKITDFGLAKKIDSVDGLTATGALLGTPSYMAPEQARGDKDVGPPADVYGLGAVLYALVTGRPPFAAASPLDVLHLVQWADPPAPASLAPGLPRDLVTVCLKCLEKDPARRYLSAAAVADDLARYLAGAPIVARPAGLAERATKWVRRNRAVTAAAAGVFAALSLGAGVAAWQAVEATAARRTAEGEAANARAAEAAAAEQAVKERAARADADRRRLEAESVTGFLQDVLAGASVYTGRPGAEVGPKWTVREAVDRAAAKLAGRFPDQPLVEAKLRHTLGKAYLHLGVLDRAEEHFTRGQAAAAAAHLPPTAVLALDLEIDLGTLYTSRGHWRKAEMCLTAAAATAEAARGPADALTLSAGYHLALLYLNWGYKFDRVGEILGRVYPAQVAALGPTNPETLASLAARGQWRKQRHETDLAEADLKAALAGRRTVQGETHPLTLDSLRQLADLYLDTGRLTEALPLMERALAGRRAVNGAQHHETLRATWVLAQVQSRRGNYAAAEPLAVAAHAGYRELFGAYHLATLEVIDGLGQIYLATQRYAEAEPLLRNLADGLERVGHRDMPFFEVQSDLGEALTGGGKHAAAVAVLEEAYRGLQSVERTPGLPRSDPGLSLRLAAERLARAHAAAGKAAAAAQWRATAATHRETAPRPR